LTADATGASASAIIERIAPAVDPATGTVKVTVAVEGGSGLRPGAFVRVDIVTDTHVDALVVARSALVAEGRRWHLYRLTDNDTSVEQVEVTLGFETGDRIEIAGTADASVEISPGETVVVVGAPALSDGAKVRVITDADTESTPEPVEQVG
jgi:multidrug efflux pump subunit AcrA (membrane-fusion protein)